MRNISPGHLRTGIGIAAAAGLVGVFVVAFFASRTSQPQQQSGVTQTQQAYIAFDSEELVYDGAGRLDLLQGVQAVDSAGQNAADKLDAVITGDGTLTRKEIRYTFQDTDGKSVSKKRTLVLKNYSGPVITSPDYLSLNAQDLPRLCEILAEKGELVCDDGYGQDITSSVRYVREKQDAGSYTITFTVYNALHDSAEKTMQASVSGSVDDPVIVLRTDELTVAVGSAFDPLALVEQASDGTSSVEASGISVQSSVNTAIPGQYRVVYTLYSSDKTAKTVKVLKVTVGENGA